MVWNIWSMLNLRTSLSRTTFLNHLWFSCKAAKVNPWESLYWIPLFKYVELIYWSLSTYNHFHFDIHSFCLNSQMIKSKVGTIKSGWRGVFMIFTTAAEDDLERIVESAFENVEQGLNQNFLFFVVIYFWQLCEFVKILSNTEEWCSYPGALQSGCWRLLYGLCELSDRICQ